MIPVGLNLSGGIRIPSVFHTRGWLQTLQRTYGYQPVAFTMSAPSGALTNALLFCVVRSWLTGNRLVSLPFPITAEPLEQPEQFTHFVWVY